MKLLKNQIKRLKIWTATELFKVFFEKYYYSFESADEKFYRMGKEDQDIYVNSINNFVRTKAFKNEFHEVIRTLYSDLANKPVDDVLLSSYRLTILFMREFRKRLEKFEETSRFARK